MLNRLPPHHPLLLTACAACSSLACFAVQPATSQSVDFGLDLPERGVSGRVSLVTGVPAGARKTFADLKGPGCIRHIWMTDSRNDHSNRNAILRIFFDGGRTPHVEAPLRDFFGVMHGRAWYPINTTLFSVQAKSGYNCYIPMPFGKSARIEIEALESPHQVYLMADWHRYPGQELREKRRFCARWRREFPTQRYGEDFFMLDADGPGQLIGFFYGLRLIDNVDRWSHGGSDNIYLDGEGEHPAYLRGIGGEDTFGTSYGGSIHTPRTHLNAAMPFYEQVDDGAARPAKHITGYRWFVNDQVRFERSIHMRFGCMQNDISATVFWYQESPVRPFFRLPGPAQLVYGRDAEPIPRATHDLPLPESGSWWVSGPLDNADDKAIRAAVATPLAESSPSSVSEETRRSAIHGFVDFGHVYRPHKRGAGVYHVAAAEARCRLMAPRDMTVQIRLAWDDHLVLRVGGQKPRDLGHRDHFGEQMVELPLHRGENRIAVTLSNTQNYNHGGWAFAFCALTSDGKMLLPEAAPSKP